MSGGTHGSTDGLVAAYVHDGAVEVANEAGSGVDQDGEGHGDDALHAALLEELVGEAWGVRLAHCGAAGACEDDWDAVGVDEMGDVVSGDCSVASALCFEDEAVCASVCVFRV